MSEQEVQEQGIKETKEVVTGAMKLGGILYAAFKDGVQATDFAVVFAKIQGDEAVRQALMEAYNDANKVPAEMKDLNVAEGIELGVHILREGAALVAVLKA